MTFEKSLSARRIDRCPTCGAAVSQVLSGPLSETKLDPCGHSVAVVIHADRVELHA